MIGRIWDVNAITGRYLCTDFVVSDSKGNMIHCSAKSNVAHNFLKMKEGRIYAVKNFVVVPNKDEFRIFKQDMFMLEFDGETTKRKVSADPYGYLRYPFRLVDLDKLEVTNNKYLIDAAGRHSLRVTLWGGLGDVLVERKTKHVEMCAMVLIGMSVKEYNNKLYLSSSSSTVIYDADDIPCLQELKADSSSVQPNKVVLVVDNSLPREGTLENILIWARSRQNNVMIENFRNKKGWNYPSCGYEKCRKGATRQNGEWFCEACNRAIDYPVFRLGYRLEVVVADDTAQTVVVMFNDTVTELIKCSTESLMVTDDEGADADAIYFTCWKINPSESVEDATSSSTPTLTADEASPELEDSDEEEVCAPVDNKKKRKRYIEDDSESA
ncbi:DNA helicase PIF1, ATP-dependent [Tanacetum coccineum]